MQKHLLFINRIDLQICCEWLQQKKKETVGNHWDQNSFATFLFFSKRKKKAAEVCVDNSQ